MKNRLLTERSVRSSDEWIKIGIDFLIHREGGWTQQRYARENRLSLSTLQKALRRYKAEIEEGYKTARKTTKKPTRLSPSDEKREMINSFRGQLKAYAKDPNASTNNKSTKWFKDRIKSSLRGRNVTRPMPGSIYAYIYDAKHKDTLDYWDRFPLIVFLGTSTTKHGVKLMHGLNLHYIPPRARQEFLEQLLIFANTKTITSKTRLNIDWSRVKSLKGAEKMIKAYLPGHIKGKMVEIDPNDWANVVYMPLQSFQSKGSRFSVRKVWKA